MVSLEIMICLMADDLSFYKTTDEYYRLTFNQETWNEYLIFHVTYSNHASSSGISKKLMI
jgi:hypothetical protein